MKIKYFIGGYDKNLCYLLWCPKSKHAAIIDPAVEINPIIEFINDNDLILDKILVTHSHHDHVKYLPDLEGYFNSIKTYGSFMSAQKFKFIPLTIKLLILELKCSLALKLQGIIMIVYVSGILIIKIFLPGILCLLEEQGEQSVVEAMSKIYIIVYTILY